MWTFCTFLYRVLANLRLALTHLSLRPLNYGRTTYTSEQDSLEILFFVESSQHWRQIRSCLEKKAAKDQILVSLLPEGMTETTLQRIFYKKKDRQVLNTTHICVWIHHDIGTVTVPTQTTRHLGKFIISDGQNPMFVSVGSIKDLFVRLIFLQSNGVWKSLYIFILISRSLSLPLI